MAHGKHWSSQYLDDKSLKEIEQAVIRAEETTNVEIIPVLEYSTASGLKGIYYLKLLKSLIAFIPSLSLTLLGASILTRVYELWTNPFYLQGALLLIFYFLFYYLFWHYSKPILPKGVYQLFADAKVKNDFYSTKAYHTKKQESLLIYGFVRERIVILYGDKRIFNKISEEEIQTALDLFIKNAKIHDLKNAFISVVESLSPVLALEFPKSKQDEDEKPNRLKIKDKNDTVTRK